MMYRPASPFKTIGVVLEPIKFSCFTLTFLSPNETQHDINAADAIDYVPGFTLAMSHRKTAERYVLMCRIAHNTYDINVHDTSVLRDAIARELANLYDNRLADYLPGLTNSHLSASATDEKELHEARKSQADSVWRAVEKFHWKREYASLSTSREYGLTLDVQLSTDVHFHLYETSRTGLVYSAGTPVLDPLAGTALLNGKSYSFKFICDLATIDLPTYLGPHGAQAALMRAVGERLPMVELTDIKFNE